MYTRVCFAGKVGLLSSNNAYSSKTSRQYLSPFTYLHLHLEGWNAI